jgi:hypothetical protein
VKIKNPFRVRFKPPVLRVVVEHSDRMKEPGMIIDVSQDIDWTYGPGVFSGFIGRR